MRNNLKVIYICVTIKLNLRNIFGSHFKNSNLFLYNEKEKNKIKVEVR